MSKKKCKGFIEDSLKFPVLYLFGVFFIDIERTVTSPVFSLSG
jgi:hypothetical protein